MTPPPMTLLLILAAGIAAHFAVIYLELREARRTVDEELRRVMNECAFREYLTERRN